MEGIKIQKKEVKLFLYADYMIVYIPRESMKKYKN